MILCDVLWLDGRPVSQSPRQILRPQVEKLDALGYRAHIGTELESIMFDDTYEETWDKKYEGLTPSTRYNLDYSLLATARLEPVIRSIRTGMEQPAS